MTNTKLFAMSLAAAAAVTAAAGGIYEVTGTGPHGTAVRSHTAAPTRLADSSCSGPAGAAYVALPGYQSFDAVNTANCDVVQNYNVDDLGVSFQPSDTNYDGTDEGIALSGSTLWFGVTGTDNVAAIDTATLDPSNYNPAETLVPVGLMPEQLAASPDGSQVWVADAGPGTSTTPLSDVAIISTATDKVVGHLHLPGDVSDVAFSPSGSSAYVTTSRGLYAVDTASRKVTGFAGGLGSPQSVAVAPDGSTVYVTETDLGRLATISAGTLKVEGTTKVGDEPWQVIVSSDGSKVYVANPDSDTVSVVDTSSGPSAGKVSDSITVPGGPDALALTPDGSQLWVTGNTSGILYVVDTATDAVTGQTNLGGYGPQSGDGMDPSGIVVTSTPTPTS